MGSIEEQQVSFTSGLSRASSPEQFSPINWFALYTTSRHEKRVSLHLQQREIEHYLPLYRAQRRWSDGSRVTLELPLFPSYLFVRMRRTDRSRVLGVPGALAVVGGNAREPVALPDEAVERLQTVLGLRAAEPHPLLTIGQKIRVRSGPLSGIEGIVLRKKNSCRVVLTVENFQRSYSVEVAEDDLEQIGGCDFYPKELCSA